MSGPISMLYAYFIWGIMICIPNYSGNRVLGDKSGIQIFGIQVTTLILDYFVWYAVHEQPNC